MLGKKNKALFSKDLRGYVLQSLWPAAAVSGLRWPELRPPGCFHTVTAARTSLVLKIMK